jgi:L-cysteine:1D-myo-inositol 2-amino-2-deoxy-alpha-D-glucopyranoside ligase
MRLYDTATQAVRPLQPAGNPVALYVCGITPYDSAHLGHAFTYHVFDVITRRLRAAGLGVRSIRNVTDCDDDIFRTARRRGIDFRTLVAEQVAHFDAAMAAIHIRPVDAAPYASGHVPAMVDWIARLVAAGFAYAREGWVYFDVSAFERYGELSHLDAERMAVLSRERGGDPDDPRKYDPLDFVLWQPSLPDEPAWESPWGAGRPGWHIECSVLAREFHPRGVDLHGGGEDLVYPHHESEIAQAEAVGPHPFARHWVHVGMVGLDGTKMSKSLGNLVFTDDLVRSASPAAVRLLLAAHHHRSAWSYHPDLLEEAVARLRVYRAACSSDAHLERDAAAALEHDFFERLDDDLDTPGALRLLDEALAGMGHGPDGGVRPAALIPRLLDVVGAGAGLAAAPASGA